MCTNNSFLLPFLPLLILLSSGNLIHLIVTLFVCLSGGTSPSIEASNGLLLALWPSFKVLYWSSLTQRVSSFYEWFFLIVNEPKVENLIRLACTDAATQINQVCEKMEFRGSKSWPCTKIVITFINLEAWKFTWQYI